MIYLFIMTSHVWWGDSGSVGEQQIVKDTTLIVNNPWTHRGIVCSHKSEHQIVITGRYLLFIQLILYYTADYSKPSTLQ